MEQIARTMQRGRIPRMQIAVTDSIGFILKQLNDYGTYKLVVQYPYMKYESAVLNVHVPVHSGECQSVELKVKNNKIINW